MPSDRNDIWLKRPEPSVAPDLSAFDGERFLTGIGGEIEAEHIHRYLFAAGLCVNKDVLDIACGEGYGSAMLARVASSMVGVDIDEPTIEYARRAYADSGVEFEPGSCESIPYKRDSFDVVVSFETIEHIEDHAVFLREIRRVLRPGGVLICSTPDTDVYRHPDGENPFHVSELTRDAYEHLLSKRFANVRILGQRLVSGSVIARGSPARTELVSTSDGSSFHKATGDAGAVYLVAVCSDERLPRIDDSVLSDARYTIGRTIDLERRLAPARAAIEGLQHAQDRADRAEASLHAAQGEVARLSEERGRLIGERNAAAHERDGAIRDAASTHLEYNRLEAVLERVRAEMIEAREKAAAAQAYQAASRTELATMQETTARALAERDQAADRLDRAHREIGQVPRSHAWGWTAPARAAARTVRSVSGGAYGLALGCADKALTLSGLPGGERVRTARRARLIRASGLFDSSWYRSAYPDVVRVGIDPAFHFAARGSLERRNPGPSFDTGYYLDANPDVAESGLHAFEHYVTQGIGEGRSPKPSAVSPASGTSPAPQLPAAPSVDIDVRETTPIVMPAIDPARVARTKALAFYLPQYHPIPENDAWWGKGFTEWTNVTRGHPMFPGHQQPILPGELGFYDLRLPEVREHQAELARAAGIYGFCYYHYWFNGRRVLEHPLDEAVRLGSPDFPFCVCWANENWTRRWDGQERHVLLQQDHTLASDRRFMLDLLPYLEDERYVRLDGKPVVLVYRPDLMTDAADTVAVWRDECVRAGIGEIHLAAVHYRTGDPRPMGFDATVEFPPHHFPAPEITSKIEGIKSGFTGAVFDYEAAVHSLMAWPRNPGYRLHRGVMPSWDNTARRMEDAHVFHGSSPELYEAWLRSAMNASDEPGESLLFINAWNEWAEGAVLEPRRDIGDAYLRATARVLNPEHALAKKPPTHDVILTESEPSSTQVEPDEDQPPAARNGAVPAEVPADDPAREPAASPGIEHRIKRFVRSNRALNGLVSRHPGLKTGGMAVIRRFTDAAEQQPETGTGKPVSDTVPALSSTARRRAWSGGKREIVGENARTILLVSHDACMAGAQLVALELLHHFAPDPGFRVFHLLCASGVLEPEMRGLATTCCLDDLGGRGRSRAGAIDEALKGLIGAGGLIDPGSVEVAICNTAATADVARACAKRGIRVTSYLHELPTTIDTSLGGAKTMRTIDRSSDRIVVVSRFVRDRLADAYGMDRSRFDVVHMGIFPSRSRGLDRVASGRALRAELGVDARTPVVLGCGSIHHRKGTDVWVAAAARAVRAARDAGVPEPVFAWVGWDQDQGGLRAWCEHHAKSAGISGRVRFLGIRDDTWNYFAGADVFALSSREDPFPLVSLEAMACGTPVVAFEGAGGAPEALRIPGSEAGLVVPFGDAAEMGDAISEILTDHKLALRLGEGGLEVTRGRLDWERYISGLLGEETDTAGLPSERVDIESIAPSDIRSDVSAPVSDDLALDKPGEISEQSRHSRPRLLVVSHDAWFGGAQLILLENLRHWVGRCGFDCRVLLARGGPLTSAFEKLVPTVRLDRDTSDPSSHGLTDPDEALRAWKRDGWEPDAAFCNTSACGPAMEAVRKRGTKIVTSVYELPTTIDASLGGAETIRGIIERSERVLVASSFVRDRLCAAYKIDAGVLEPVHTGVLTRVMPERDVARAAVRRELDLPEGTPIVLGCGSVHHRKGTDLFVAAAAETLRGRDEHADNPLPEPVFVWVGEDQSGPTFRNWCRHDAERLGVADRVRFVGASNDPGRWFMGADVFALTSREDPFPMVNLEAIAAGLPVVAFDGAGGAPEVLTPNRLGEVVPYADARAMGEAIRAMLADPRGMGKTRERAIAFAQHQLGWDAYIDRLNECLASCSGVFDRHTPSQTDVDKTDAVDAPIVVVKTAGMKLDETHSAQEPHP